MNETQMPNMEEKTPEVRPGNYSPVTVHIQDSLGALFLGILSYILLIGWVRAEARNRQLVTELAARESKPQA